MENDPPSVKEEKQVVTVYNPYILHLLYIKMKYLFNVINRLYTRHEDDFAFLLDHCVLKNHYAEVLVQDLVLLRDRMYSEKFPIELALCHFEVYLFRTIQTFRTALEPLDSLFTSGYYQCETALTKTITRDTHTMALQKLLREYTREYYLSHNPAKSTQRITLFFNMKNLLEKEVSSAVIDKEESLFYIRYDSELVATLFYLYFISQLYCLNEMETTRLNPALLLDNCVIKQRKLFSSASQLKKGGGGGGGTNIATTTTKTGGEEFSIIETILQRAFHSLYLMYQSLVIDRLTFYTRENATNHHAASEESYGFFSSFMSSSGANTTSTTSTTSTKLHIPVYEESYLNYLRIVNHEYRLSTPSDGALAPMLRPCFDGSNGGNVKRIGRSAFYNEPLKSKATGTNGTILVPLVYLPLRENPTLYVLCLYRLAFDVKLGQAHNECKTSSSTGTTKKKAECYLCAYTKRDKENNLRFREFITHCNSFDIENPSPSQSTQATRLCEVLDKVHLHLMPSRSLRNYKTLTTVFWLFEFIPLSYSKQSEKHSTHNLFRMINPTTLMTELTRTVTTCELDKAMWNLICISYKKLHLEAELLASTSVVSEEEHRLAMECEIVRLLAEAVNMQFNEIQCYQRSLSVEVALDATQLCREVAAAFKKIYLGHLNILLQVIMERRDHVEFDI